MERKCSTFRLSIYEVAIVLSSLQIIVVLLQDPSDRELQELKIPRSQRSAGRSIQQDDIAQDEDPILLHGVTQLSMNHTT